MIERLDHLVLTVRNIEATLAFYTDVLGMEEVTFGAGRKALRFGRQKINLHVAGHELNPKAKVPIPGSADLCFIAAVSFEEVVERLQRAGTEIIEGPIERTGAVGQIRSIYCRDPDANLVEIANYEQ